MSSKPEGAGARASWLVGAAYGSTNDQTPRFLKEGIWENGYKDKYLALKQAYSVSSFAAYGGDFFRRTILCSPGVGVGR